MGLPQEMPDVSSRRVVGIALYITGLWLFVTCSGCSTIEGPNTAARPAAAPASASTPEDPFAPTPPPGGYDPLRAQALLSTIPDNPPAPSPAGQSISPELPRQALKRMAEARLLFADQRYAEAASLADDSLRYNSNNIEACRLAALASLLSSNDKQARHYANTGIENSPDDLACHYILARVAEKAEQFDLALFEYRTALKCPPDINADYLTLTRYRLGLLLHGMGFYRATIQQLAAFEAAIDALAGKKPSNPELTDIAQDKRLPALAALANSYEALGQYGPAADTLAAATGLAPNDSSLCARHIKALVRARRFNAAADRAADHAANTRGDLEAVQLLLDVHRAAGHQARGLATVKQIVSAHPDNGELALLYAQALANAKQYGLAVQVLNDATVRHPEQASAARWKLVAIHRLQSNPREWLWVLAAQLASDPTDTASAMDELARMPAADAARLVSEALAERLEIPPEIASTGAVVSRYYCLGRLAERLNQVDDARTLFGRALKADPGYMPAVVGMAESFINVCQWSKGLTVLKAAKTDAHAWQAVLNRLIGLCYDGLDDYTEATDYYRQAAKLDADDSESLLLLGKMLDRASRPREARRVYEQMTAAYPKLIEARERLVLNLLNHWGEGDNLKQMVAELKEMQSKAAKEPATIRTTALARLLMQQPPDLKDYVRVLNSLVEAYPNDSATRRALVTALYRIRDLDAARKQAVELLAKAPCDSESNELICLVLMKQLDITAAAEYLTRAMERYPNREMFLRNLAEVRLAQQDYPASIALWERALALKTNADRHPAYRGRLISTCLQARRYDKIRELTEQWLKNADNQQIAMLRSYLLAADAAEGKYDQYLGRCRKWLDTQPNDRQAREWLLGIGTLPGQATGGLIGAGRLDDAVTQATAWVAQAPAESEPRQMLLQTLRAVRRGADLVEMCRADLALVDNPQQKVASLQSLADAYLTDQKYDNAIATLKEMADQIAQISDEDMSFALEEMIISLLTQAKRFDDAIVQANKLISDLDNRDERLQQLAASEPGDMGRKLQVFKEQERIRRLKAEALRSLSFVYTKQNQRDSTIDCLRQALKLDPNDAGTNNDLGYSLADAGMSLDEAERMLRLAVGEVLWVGVGEDSRQAAFLDSLGWLYYKRGKFSEAAAWLELGTKMQGGRDPLIHDHLGDAQWRIGRLEQARQSWSLAIELHHREVAEGKTNHDDKLIAGIKKKQTEAGRAGGNPAVATAAAD